jgi:hypothetical protein
MKSAIFLVAAFFCFAIIAVWIIGSEYSKPPEVWCVDSPDGLGIECFREECIENPAGHGADECAIVQTDYRPAENPSWQKPVYEFEQKYRFVLLGSAFFLLVIMFSADRISRAIGKRGQ